MTEIVWIATCIQINHHLNGYHNVYHCDPPLDGHKYVTIRTDYDTQTTALYAAKIEEPLAKIQVYNADDKLLSMLGYGWEVPDSVLLADEAQQWPTDPMEGEGRTP